MMRTRNALRAEGLTELEVERAQWHQRRSTSTFVSWRNDNPGDHFPWLLTFAKWLKEHERAAA